MTYSNDEKIIARETYISSGWTYEQGESGKWKCPLCGYFSFDEPDDFDYCPICNFVNTQFMLKSGDIRLGHKMTYNEAKEAWKKGIKFE